MFNLQDVPRLQEYKFSFLSRKVSVKSRRCHNHFFFGFALLFFFLVTETVRQHVFIKNDFHYLNVPRVGTVTVYEVFDCTFECLSNPLCFSVNLAASKGAHGKLWCELLSSDKYRNYTEYKGNQSSHHFAIKVGNSLSNL